MRKETKYKVDQIKLISADGIFSDMEDIDLVYRAVEEKLRNLGENIYDLKSGKLFSSDMVERNVKIEDIIEQMKRCERILDHIVEYKKVRERFEVKKE